MKSNFKDPEEYFEGIMQKLDSIAKSNLVMVLTKDFIRIHDNALDQDVCNSLMHIFDSNEKSTKR